MTVDELRTIINLKRNQYIELDLEMYSIKTRTPINAASSKRMVELNLLLDQIDTELRSYIEQLKIEVGDGYTFEVASISGSHLSESVGAYMEIVEENKKDFVSREQLQQSMLKLNEQNLQNVARNYKPIIDKNVSVSEEGKLRLPSRKLTFRYKNTER